MDQLHLLAKYLMLHEKIEREDFEVLMRGEMDPAMFEDTPAEPEETAPETAQPAESAVETR